MMIYVVTRGDSRPRARRGPWCDRPRTGVRREKGRGRRGREIGEGERERTDLSRVASIEINFPSDRPVRLRAYRSIDRSHGHFGRRLRTGVRRGVPATATTSFPLRAVVRPENYLVMSTAFSLSLRAGIYPRNTISSGRKAFFSIFLIKGASPRETVFDVLLKVRNFLLIGI